MDDTLTPKRAAKVKATYRNPLDSSDTEDSGEEQESDMDETDDAEEESSDDQELSQASDHAPSPGCRRSSRTLSNRNIPNYDRRYVTLTLLVVASGHHGIVDEWVRFHPAFDKALRPASARAALVRKAKGHTSRKLSTETSTGSSEDEGTITDENPKGAGKASYTTASPVTKPSFSEMVSVSVPSHERKSAVRSSPSQAKTTEKESSELLSPPPPSNLQNPHLGKVSLDYNKLDHFDQLIYSMQKGAPVHGNTLPLPWQTVKQALFDHGEITLDELNSEEATEWLKLRYEYIRLGIEAYFKSKPETADKNDWTFCKYEKFDAFDKEPGRKYWKHYRHSIFSPTTTTTNADYNKLMEVPETDEEEEGRREQKGPTLYNDFITLKDQSTVSIVDYFKVGDCTLINDGLEEARNHDNEGGIQERKTPIIDLEDWGDEDDTLVETMHGEEVVSSEGLMSREELGEIIADFVDGPFSTRHDAKLDIPGPLNTNNDQTLVHHKIPDNRAPASPYITHHSSAPPPSRGFQATNKAMQADPPDSGIPHPVKRPKSKKRKPLPSPSASVQIHEDTPGSSPKIANNPPSPGTDLPIENLQDENENEAEHSSQVSISVRTPRAARFRLGATAAAAAASPFRLRSLFGGPEGLRSSPRR